MKVRQEVTLTIEFDKDKPGVEGPGSPHFDWRKLVERPGRHWEVVGVRYGPELGTLAETIEYLDTKTLAMALWWVMEEIADEDPRGSDLYFYLRGRVRTET